MERTGPDENSTQEVDEDSPGLTVFKNEIRALLANVADAAVTEIIQVIVAAELADMDSLLALAGVSDADVAQSNQALQKQVVDSLNIC
ncbi:hypothetical protein WJX77_012704 [Trebouxia sp. C0004]